MTQATAGFFAAICALASAPAVYAQGPLPPSHIDDFSGRPRVIVISDVGNEPDDQMSFVRFLIYSNEFDVEAMIAATSTWQKSMVHPETMHALVHAYGDVRPHLLLHANGWPTAEDLDQRVYAGQRAYGMAATGPHHTSEGARAIAQAGERDDSRPLWICIWGGANTLAQALLEMRTTHSDPELSRLIARLRVYSISDQDDAGPWVRREFPGLFYIVQPSTQDADEYYSATWTGISGDPNYRSCTGEDTSNVTNDWLDVNIRSRGPLGKVYPRLMYIMEGDTPSFLGLIDNGLNAYRRPDWGGWGGRYVYRQPHGESHPIWTQGGTPLSGGTSQDTVRGAEGRQCTSDQATIWRWRDAFQNDFAARMTWSVADFAHANHNPIVEVNGQNGTVPILIDAEIGKPVILDAGASHDPDGQSLHFLWFHYSEAGSASGPLAGVTLSRADTAKAVVTPVTACRPMGPGAAPPCPGTGTAHIILAVTDDGSPPLTSYRRIILTVHQNESHPN